MTVEGKISPVNFHFIIKVVDVFAGNKLRDLYKQIDELNLATLDDYKKLLEFESDNSRKEQIIQRALRHFPSSDFLWSRLLRLKMDDGNTNGKDVQKLFNDAERAVNCFSWNFLNIVIEKSVGVGQI